MLSHLSQLTTHVDDYAADGPDWPPSSFEESMSWFQTKRDAIPAEFRASMKIGFYAAANWHGEGIARIGISYSRPETEQERRDRWVKERRGAVTDL